VLRGIARRLAVGSERRWTTPSHWVGAAARSWFTGEQPSNRETATACGISHTAVAKALVRMRPYFEQARQTARDP